MHVMLIEDNRMDAIVFKKLLSRIANDCAVSAFDDGEKAIEHLMTISKNNPGELPDLIVSDLYMPKLNGHDIVGFVKNNENLRRIPVVLLSSSKSGHDINMAYKLQASCYMVKPLQLSEYTCLISDMWNFWSKVARPALQ